ncbi:hypothetical protein TNCV_4427951 [Trichonephila clavipes]|nr:hypothetical protein TNCV_4427951 [Trichonephila clavipes]
MFDTLFQLHLRSKFFFPKESDRHRSFFILRPEHETVSGNESNIKNVNTTPGDTSRAIPWSCSNRVSEKERAILEHHRSASGKKIAQMRIRQLMSLPFPLTNPKFKFLPLSATGQTNGWSVCLPADTEDALVRNLGRLFRSGAHGFGTDLAKKTSLQTKLISSPVLSSLV